MTVVPNIKGTYRVRNVIDPNVASFMFKFGILFTGGPIRAAGTINVSLYSGCGSGMACGHTHKCLGFTI
jgi:hypothetical protein